MTITTQVITGTNRMLFIESLDRANTDGTLDARTLATAIRTTGDAGFDTQPYSLGFEWLSNNEDSFLRIVTDVEHFFRELFDCRYVTLVLHHPALIERIRPERRYAFVRDLLVESHGYNSRWLEALCHLNMRHDVVRLTLEMLENTVILPDHQHNFILDDFMHYGPGKVVEDADGRLHFDNRVGDRDPLWAYFNQTTFEQAVEICIAKIPDLLLRHGWHHFSIRRLLTLVIDTETLDKLAATTAANLESFDNLSLDELYRLPVHVRVTLMSNMYPKVPPLLLVLTALEMLPEKGIELCGLLKEVFDRNDAALMYRQTWQLLAQGDTTNPPMAAWLRELITAKLHEAGYMLGQVQKVSHWSKKNRSNVVQMCVNTSVNKRYVGERYNSYQARPDEWVIFHPDRTLRELVPGSVYVVTFHPAHHYDINR